MGGPTFVKPKAQITLVFPLKSVAVRLNEKTKIVEVFF